MSNYIIRFDDASDYWDPEKWGKCFSLCEKYSVSPILAIIPDCRDPQLMNYGRDDTAWKKIQDWVAFGATPALHGFRHVYTTEQGGINPIHQRSEFAGEPLDVQREKIREGYKALCQKELKPRVFVAPSHTFDRNTMEALKLETDIRVISDTIANDAYMEDEFLFLPQQSGNVRDLRFSLVTFCYHPNTMTDHDFMQLEAFISEHKASFVSADEIISKGTTRQKKAIDRFLSFLYFTKRKLKVAK